MLFQSSFHLLIYSSVLFVLIHSERIKRETTNYAPKCIQQTTAVDQVIDYPKPNLTTISSRRKRFVLFPEFILFLDNWNYINAPKDIYYWIANFYPDQVNTSYIHRDIKEIIRQINTVLDRELTVREAVDPGEANFHFHLFDYTQCPMDDPKANTTGVQAAEALSIYTKELTMKSRYRAHGGISLLGEGRRRSQIKFNMQQKYILSDDFVYDPVIYTCVDETNECVVDFFWVLLHETLHGFGIEHTTNAQNPTPPNQRMQSVMYFSNLRMLCHDDIRAIRMVYNLTVKRENKIYDDTCRRDFPMSFLQKFMYLLDRYLKYALLGFILISCAVFILTMIYILLRWLLSKREPSEVKSDKPMLKKKGDNKPHGYLWHDDMI